MTYIIAEIGVNHNGNVVLAKKLIREAKKSGANAVKFQSYISDELVTRKSKLASYQKKNYLKNNMYLMLKKYELSQKKQLLLFNYCKKLKIEFLSSAFDLKSLDFLINVLKIKKIKVPSGEITNYPLLKAISKSKLQVILSTGMSNIKEIQDALKVLKSNGLKNKMITILHCNSSYPTPKKDVNLLSMLTLKDLFKTKVGFSDHTMGICASTLAVVLGAEVIEKHITLDKKFNGPDHSSSITPKEFKNMVNAIKNIKIILGSKKKLVTKSEVKNLKYSRKSIVASKNIAIGEKLTIENITTKRPAYGLSPLFWKKIINSRAKKNYKKDDFIKR